MTVFGLNTITQSMIDFLNMQSPDIRARVIENILPDGFVVSSPEREEAIERMRMMVASIDRDQKTDSPIHPRLDRVG